MHFCRLEKVWAVLFLSCLFASGCGGGGGGPSEIGTDATTTISGTILDAYNQPVKGAEVTVNSEQIIAITDENGKFLIDTSPGEQQIIITKNYLAIYSTNISVFENSPISLGNIKTYWDNAIEADGPRTQCEADRWAEILLLRGFQYLIELCNDAGDSFKCNCYHLVYLSASEGAKRFSVSEGAVKSPFDPLGPELLKKWLNGEGKKGEDSDKREGTDYNEYPTKYFDSEDWTLEKYVLQMMEPKNICFDNYTELSGNIMYSSPESKHSKTSPAGVGDFDYFTTGQYHIDCSSKTIDIAVTAQATDTVDFNEKEGFCLGGWEDKICRPYSFCGHSYEILIPDEWGLYLRDSERCSDGIKFRDYGIRSKVVNNPSETKTRNLSDYNCFTVECSDNDNPIDDNENDMHWIGNWIQINFLANDHNGEWPPDEPDGIGFVSTVTETEIISRDEYGCSVTYSYSIHDGNKYTTIATNVSGCPFSLGPHLNGSGWFEFYEGNNIMIEYFDQKPGDTLVAFKWMKQ